MNKYINFSKLLYEFYNEEDVLIDAPMSEHIYFKVGGPADILVTPNTKEQVIKTINLCREHNVPYFLLGNGSNLLVKDGGVEGVVIKFCKLNKITVNGNELTAYSGALLKDVCKAALAEDLVGIEFSCGIPGSIGGAACMNAGAYNGEIAEVIKEVEAIDTLGNLVTLNREKLALGYRSSLIMKEHYAVISVTLTLQKGVHDKIEFRINDLTRRREERQPLEYPSAGSTFKRPEGHFAAKLIEDAGLKGFSIGGASVSNKHSGFVINHGQATAKDILDVIAHVQKVVKEKFDVDLKTEVRIIGRD
ncbi:MAG: UDP-N-acetylmuramate dehydrogenase [Sarcina ventriculi]|uniref:UDP-N-acetylenolpyruvoylglucosamine reductase n=1 Tax=Sarcina ventriculi TaxID=1267 RepID=A0ABM9URR5_SARVE|nr:UDP-N-acetylmuramate dehydrogenase [Sarcina ventriculi]MDO4401811.1 UDP-N-acetylmuramate dehydrogenase [Clostridiaceae bacterium]MBU5323144.1 UDP-N-acetylmuramate dehydrogenase [Sarcina ventriculi]MCI5637121.1 UDP-N-acetylmuramate dehydrogenase [Sarcina ventriculi]MDD7373712.1 UDP-N-acetylmuramate dehydrogenase [Sarcina ventriculi]MDY7062121.1 UDP-N-acetylmuramate dehydrogenase [Sarcina ventriculi]